MKLLKIGLVCLAGITAHVSADDPNTSSEEAIRNKLGLYAVSLDTRNFDAFFNVFAPNVVARLAFPPPFEVLYNLTEMIEAVAYGLGDTPTQHKLSSIYVNVESAAEALSTSYLHATYFSAPASGTTDGIPNDDILDVFGFYHDQWMRDPEGDWLIVNRNLTLFPPVGDARLLIPTTAIPTTATNGTPIGNVTSGTPMGNITSATPVGNITDGTPMGNATNTTQT